MISLGGDLTAPRSTGQAHLSPRRSRRPIRLTPTPEQWGPTRCCGRDDHDPFTPCADDGTPRGVRARLLASTPRPLHVWVAGTASVAAGAGRARRAAPCRRCRLRAGAAADLPPRPNSPTGRYLTMTEAHLPLRLVHHTDPSAVFSPSGDYRYRIVPVWDSDASTAGHGDAVSRQGRGAAQYRDTAVLQRVCSRNGIRRHRHPQFVRTGLTAS